MSMMSERSLKAGCVLVPAVKDRLRLYSMRFCPYAQRTRLVLHHKKIPHEIVNVNLKDKPDWLFKRNPYGLVPIIEYNDHVTYESSVCGELLDELFPQNRLLPKCPYERARHRLVMLAFDKNIRSLYGMLSQKEEKRLKSAENITSLLAELETVLRANKTHFLGGNEIGLVDYHVWPWFERFPAFSTLSGDPFVSREEFPMLKDWTKKMDEQDAVRETKMSTELHAGFILSLVNRNPLYDLGLDADAKL